MAIKVRLTGRSGVGGVGVEFYLACDDCGGEIDLRSASANCEFVPEDDSEVFVLHKECSSQFRKGKPRMNWVELTTLNLRTQ
jgi:hypothetical protein